jgi:hypothetical protein
MKAKRQDMHQTFLKIWGFLRRWFSRFSNNLVFIIVGNIFITLGTFFVWITIRRIYTYFYICIQKKVDCIGTVRADRRDLPKTVLGATFKERGDRIVKTYRQFTLACWMDSKEVRFLSSMGSGSFETDKITRMPTAHREARTVMDITWIYNNYMSGVDINDQMKAGRKVIIIYNRLLESEIKKDTKHCFGTFSISR